MIYSEWFLYKQVYLKWIRVQHRNNYLQQVRTAGKPLFIHINRTGGTSVAAGLGISPIHFSLKEYELIWQKKYNEPIPQLTVYSCVRNPYHRAVSQYYYRIKSGQNKMHKVSISFLDWLQEVHLNKNPRYRDRELMFQSQSAWLESEVERPLAILRFEQLQQDYKRVFAAFKPEPLPWKRSSDRPDYNNVLCSESKALLAEVYTQDFENFNYEV